MATENFLSRKIKISLTAENGRAVLSVRDYGNGIPENELANIWDRYYTTRMRKGSNFVIDLPIE